MRKIFIVCVLLVLVVSCRKNTKAVPDQEDTALEMNAKKWAKKSRLNAKAKPILEKWSEFNALETSFDALYTVENTDDLSLVLEDLIEKQKLLEASEYPMEFDKPQIKGRQKVIKTYILKIKEDLEYQLDVDTSVKKLIEAHNAFLNQFNVIVNSTMPKEILLLNE